MSNRYILYIEDDADARDLLKVALEKRGYEVIAADTAAKCLRFARLFVFDLIILDNWSPESAGVELCRQLRSVNSSTPIFFYSAAGGDSEVAAGRAAGAQAYFLKPDFNKLLTAIGQLFSADERDAPTP